MASTDENPSGDQLVVSTYNEALQVIGAQYAPVRLEVHGDPRAFSLQLRARSVPGLTYGYVRFGTEVRVTAASPSCYLICLASTGELGVASPRGQEAVAGTRGAIADAHEATYYERWSTDAELFCIRIDTVTLGRTLTQLIGRQVREPVRFLPGFDLAVQASLSLRHVLHMLRMEANNPGVMSADPRGGSRLTETVVSALLLSQPNNYWEELHKPATAGAPEFVRLARDRIEADPLSIGTIGDLADQVHISVRSLEDGFRRYVGTTPLRYLRDLRLARVRAELVAADPLDDSVARIASRWGFRHPGRFAEVYRTQFGEQPSATLRLLRM